MFPETGRIHFRYLSLFIDTILCEVIIGPLLMGGTMLAVVSQVFAVGDTHTQSEIKLVKGAIFRPEK